MKNKMVMVFIVGFVLGAGVGAGVAWQSQKSANQERVTNMFYGSSPDKMNELRNKYGLPPNK